MVQKVENGFYQVNFSGFNQPSIPKNDEDMLEAAKSLPTTDIKYIIDHGEPASEIDIYKKPKNQRIYYEKVCWFLCCNVAIIVASAANKGHFPCAIVQMALPKGLFFWETLPAPLTLFTDKACQRQPAARLPWRIFSRKRSTPTWTFRSGASHFRVPTRREQA